MERDPVSDSERMPRRSLRLAAAARKIPYAAGNRGAPDSSSDGNMSSREQRSTPRGARGRRRGNRPSSSVEGSTPTPCSFFAVKTEASSFWETATSGMFHLLGTMGHQMAIYIFLLRLFLLRRPLPTAYKLVLILIPLLYLLASLTWTRNDRLHGTPYQEDDSSNSFQPPKTDFLALHREHELRILRLEDLLGKLSEESKGIQKHLEVAQAREDDVQSHILTKLKNLELELSQIKSEVPATQVRTIVNKALNLYSEDRTGLVDFALESGGGSILSTRSTETYDASAAVVSLFGIPLWHITQSPTVVIQPDVNPGNCWPFKGSQGRLVIRLSMKIYPSAFTMEHIPKTPSPTGTITSAPRRFLVYGLDDEYQESGTLLGAYEYDQEGEPLQMFPVMENGGNAFQIVELKVLSNWGNEDYTCLYRFRVHGSVAQ